MSERTPTGSPVSTPVGGECEFCQRTANRDLLAYRLIHEDEYFHAAHQMEEGETYVPGWFGEDLPSVRDLAGNDLRSS